MNPRLVTFVVTCGMIHLQMPNGHETPNPAGESNPPDTRSPYAHAPSHMGLPPGNGPRTHPAVAGARLNRILETERKRLWMAAYAIVRNVMDADDCVQDAWLHVNERVTQYRDIAPVLYTAVVNAAIDIKRKRKATLSPEMMEEHTPALQVLETPLQDREQAEERQRTCDRLQWLYSQCTELELKACKAYAEHGTILAASLSYAMPDGSTSLPVGTIKRCFHELRRKLCVSGRKRFLTSKGSLVGMHYASERMLRYILCPSSEPLAVQAESSEMIRAPKTLDCASGAHHIPVTRWDGRDWYTVERGTVVPC